MNFYLFDIDKKLEKNIYNKQVNEFIYTDSHIFLIGAEEMKLGDDNIIYYTGNSIIKTEYNGENIKNLNQKLRFEYPLNLCEYDEEYIAFIIKDGIVKMNKNTGKLTYLYHISLDYLGIGKLCIYNNSIFFTKYNSICKSCTVNKKEISYAINNSVEKIFYCDDVISNLFPVEDKIIFKTNNDKWYYYENGEIQKILFDIN